MSFYLNVKRLKKEQLSCASKNIFTRLLKGNIISITTLQHNFIFSCCWWYFYWTRSTWNMKSVFLACTVYYVEYFIKYMFLHRFFVWSFCRDHRDHMMSGVMQVLMVLLSFGSETETSSDTDVKHSDLLQALEVLHSYWKSIFHGRW